MSFKNPQPWERKAKDICDLLGITEISPLKFRRLAIKLTDIESDGADAAYSRLGRNLVDALGEKILAEIRRSG